MTDNSVSDAAPPQLLPAVRNLWDAGFRSEKTAFASAHFRMLSHVCASLYPDIPASRLAKPPKSDLSRHALIDALQHFFRWTGASWYDDTRDVTAEAAATRLHSAFTMRSVNRIYLAPLDQFGLYDVTTRPHEPLRHLGFGDCEIALLNTSDLIAVAPVAALRRFERRYWLEPDGLAGFYYLIVRVREDAGPFWERGAWRFLHRTLDSFTRIQLYQLVFDEPMEDAIFTTLLGFLADSGENIDKPFAIPWAYSFTDDPFSRPAPAPDSTLLSRTIVGEPGDECEVPDQSNHFELTKTEIEKALGDRWRYLQSALRRAEAGEGNFHPLAKHFFIKAFAEDGIDEIVALISCVEATLKMHKENRNSVLRRYEALTQSAAGKCWLNEAYCVRNRHLHGGGEISDITTLEEVAKCRWAVAKAVDAYLKLADEKSGANRETLLKSLDADSRRD